MDSIVLASTIGAVGVIGGALVNVPEIKDFFRSSKGPGSDLRGKWLCEWFIDKEGSSTEAETKDRIEIGKVVGSKIAATGVSPLIGEYKLSGLVSKSNVVTLTFSDTNQETLTGVVILEINTVRDQMIGFWHQLSPDRKLVGGRTIWQRGSGMSLR